MKYGNTIEKYIDELNKYLKDNNLHITITLDRVYCDEPKSKARHSGISIYLGTNYSYYDWHEIDYSTPDIEAFILGIVEKLLKEEKLKYKIYGHSNGHQSTGNPISISNSL
jgi:hypothetical protein